MSGNVSTRRFGEVCGLRKGKKPRLVPPESEGAKPYLVAKYLRGGAPEGFALMSDKTSVTVGPQDIIIICDGSNSGETFIGFEGVLSSTMAVIDHGQELDNRFLRYFLSMLFEKFNTAKTGAAIPHLDLAALRDERLPMPSVPEQQRVVAILDGAFEGIAIAKANAEKNLQDSSALFGAYLKFVFTEHGDGWVQKRLHDVASEFGRGKSKHRPRNDSRLYGGQYPFIQTGDVRNSEHEINSYTQTYNELGLAQSKLWPAGTLCITIAANIAETGVLGFDACFPDSVIGLVADESQSSSEFIEYLLQHFKTELQARGKGSAQDNINLATFEDLTFPFPSLDSQASIVAKLDCLRLERRRLESVYQRKLEALDALKQSLLHHAFSGQL